MQSLRVGIVYAAGILPVGWPARSMNGLERQMIPRYRQGSNCGVSHAQMTAAKIAELESATEARLTTLSHSSTAAKTEKPTSGFYVPTVMVTRRIKMLPKSQWPDVRSLNSKPTGSQNVEAGYGESLMERLSGVTEIEFP